ncbi:N-glycosylase/DNA lyase [Desulfurobacterium sp.]
MNSKVYSGMKKTLSSMTINDVIQIEKSDPQFQAIKELSTYYKDKRVSFVKLVVINALLSYQLPMRGEEYWKRFSEFFSVHSRIEDFPEFLKLNNYRLLKTRLKRFEKVKRAVDEVFKTENDVEIAMKDIKGLLDKLSKALKQRKDAKTVVFAIKMFIYACRTMYDENLTAPKGIFIPMDSRIRSISEDKNFWKRLEEETGIPLIHIDAVLWLSHKKWKV